MTTRETRSLALAAVGFALIAVTAVLAAPLPNVRDAVLALVGLAYVVASLVARSGETAVKTRQLTAAAFPGLVVAAYALYRAALTVAFPSPPPLDFHVFRLFTGVLLVFPVVLGVTYVDASPTSRRRIIGIGVLSVVAGALLSLVALPVAWASTPVQVVAVALTAAVVDAIAVVPVVFAARTD